MQELLLPLTPALLLFGGFTILLAPNLSLGLDSAQQGRDLMEKAGNLVKLL